MPSRYISPEPGQTPAIPHPAPPIVHKTDLGYKHETPNSKSLPSPPLVTSVLLPRARAAATAAAVAAAAVAVVALVRMECVHVNQAMGVNLFDGWKRVGYM